MKVTQFLVKTAYRTNGGSLLTDSCAGAFVSAIARSAFLIGS